MHARNPWIASSGRLGESNRLGENCAHLVRCGLTACSHSRKACVCGEAGLKFGYRFGRPRAKGGVFTPLSGNRTLWRIIWDMQVIRRGKCLEKVNITIDVWVETYFLPYVYTKGEFIVILHFCTELATRGSKVSKNMSR